jgi:cation:H+ antiporter
MLITAGAISIGLILLAWGADRFVTGAAALAHNFGISPVIIGVTIVGFATSAPEMLVSALAAMDGVPDIAIGNAVGSNIANLGLVLGTAALLRPLAVRSKTLRRELPALLLSTVLPFVLILDGRLGRADAGALVAGLVVLAFWLTWLGYRSSEFDPMRAAVAAELQRRVSTGGATLRLASGLAALLAGAQLLVYGAEQAARAVGVSELVIGLTIVAIGTSLPELAVSVAAARKNETDLVLGNVIGSNIFNLLGVIGIAGLIAPHEMPRGILSLHYPFMAAMTLGVFFLTYNRAPDHRLGRNAGAALTSTFVIYHAVLAWQTLAA